MDAGKPGPTARDLQARIDDIEWYHDFDFGNGLRARSQIDNVDNVRLIWRFIEDQLDRLDFRGKSVLDVGSWDGYWSFYAERRGAASVLSTDDASQNWAASQGIHLARELLRSNVTVRQDVSIYDLASLNQRFDIILCLGVFYHLRDPFYGFTQLRHCCHPDSVVILEGEVGWTGMHANEVQFLYNNWLEFLPTAEALERLLKGAYLQPQSRAWRCPLPAAPSEEGPLGTDRVLLVCTPLNGVNDSYLYRPHFGLHVYDDRFRSGEAPSSVPRVWQPRDLRAAIEILDLPARVEPAEEFSVTVRVTNTGQTGWTALRTDAGAALDYDRAFLDKHIVSSGYANVDPVARYRAYVETNHLQKRFALGVQLWDLQTEQTIDGDYARGFLGADLAPGEDGIVSVRMRAPSTSGIYALKFDMVKEYVTWFEPAGSAVELEYLNVSGAGSHPDSRAAARLAAMLQVVDVPAPRTIVVRAENCGDTVWLRGPLRAGGHVQLGVQLLTSDGRVAQRDWLRVALPRSVSPGEAVVVRIQIPDSLAPAGPLRLKVDLVDELRGWFEDGGSATLLAVC